MMGPFHRDSSVGGALDPKAWRQFDLWRSGRLCARPGGSVTENFEDRHSFAGREFPDVFRVAVT
jgi:hypothetical protein